MVKKDADPKLTKQERYGLLKKIDQATDKPLIFLSFIWLILIILDLSVGLHKVFLTIFYIIWGLFVTDFIIELIIAPNKRVYLKNEWLNIISLIIPGFRILNLFQGFRLIQLIKLYASIIRNIEGLAIAFKKRGFAFILSFTVIVILAGAAGILYFENPNSLHQAGIYHIRGIRNYGDALWWAAMILTTMGSDYWPKTAGGRILCWFLAVYSFTFFGYITGIIASYFIETSKKIN